MKTSNCKVCGVSSPWKCQHTCREYGRQVPIIILARLKGLHIFEAYALHLRAPTALSTNKGYPIYQKCPFSSGTGLVFESQIETWPAPETW